MITPKPLPEFVGHKVDKGELRLATRGPMVRVVC